MGVWIVRCTNVSPGAALSVGALAPAPNRGMDLDQDTTGNAAHCQCTDAGFRLQDAPRRCGTSAVVVGKQATGTATSKAPHEIYRHRPGKVCDGPRVLCWWIMCTVSLVGGSRALLVDHVLCWWIRVKDSGQDARAIGG